MTLTRWSPNTDLVPWSQMMRQLFNDDFLRPMGEWPANGYAAIPVDICDNGTAITVKAAVHGLKSEDLQVEVKDNILTISGEHKQEQQQEGENWYVREQQYGHFARSLRLPAPVQSDQVSATLKDGILTLHLPKQESSAGNRIQVKNG